MYFRGAGTSAGGDLAEANQIATGDLFADIIRFMGVQITSETTAKAKGGLDSFQTEVEQAVRQKGSARLAGFDINETWLDERRPPAVTTHLLAKYSKQEFLKEKARLEALSKEKEEAIAGPEREGKKLEAEARYYEAAIQFMLAAAAAYKSDIENAPIKFKRNIDQAMGAVEKINLLKLNDNLTSLIGKEFPEPFKLKIVTGGTSTDPGVPNVALRVSYTAYHAPSAKMQFLEANMKTDATGLLQFQHPIPQFVGNSQVHISMDLSSYIDALDSVPKEQQGLVEGLETLLVKKKVSFAFTVNSNAKNIKTGVLLIDYDENGNIRGVTETTGALQSVLIDFSLLTISKSAAVLKDQSETDIYELLKQEYQGKAERIILGSVKVLNYTERSGKYFAKATGSVKVFELATDSIVYTSTKEKSTMGNSQSEAAGQVFKELGKTLGSDIKNNLK
jgi:hypothetical protein